jgi:hypothetical protein
MGQIIVHDMRNTLNIQPTRSYIGGYKESNSSRSEVLQSSFTLGLRQVAMNHRYISANSSQFPSEPICADFRGTEDESTLD